MQIVETKPTLKVSVSKKGEKPQTFYVAASVTAESLAQLVKAGLLAQNEKGASFALKQVRRGRPAKQNGHTETHQEQVEVTKN